MELPKLRIDFLEENSNAILLVYRKLKNKYPAKAEEFRQRAYGCDTYTEVLVLTGEYVEWV